MLQWRLQAPYKHILAAWGMRRLLFVKSIAQTNRHWLQQHETSRCYYCRTKPTFRAAEVTVLCGVPGGDANPHPHCRQPCTTGIVRRYSCPCCCSCYHRLDSHRVGRKRRFFAAPFLPGHLGAGPQSQRTDSYFFVESGISNDTTASLACPCRPMHCSRHCCECVPVSMRPTVRRRLLNCHQQHREHPSSFRAFPCIRAKLL